MISRVINSLKYPKTPLQLSVKRFLRLFVRILLKAEPDDVLTSFQKDFHAGHWRILAEDAEPLTQLTKSLENITKRLNRPPVLKGAPDIHLLIRQTAAGLREAVNAQERERIISLAERLVMMNVADLDAFQAYLSVIRLLNGETIQTFKKHSTPRLILHVSCRARFNRAVESCRSFDAVEAEGVSQVIVTGDPSRQTYYFDPVTKHLVVPVPDVYEHLPAKVMSAMFFFALCGETEAVLKVDDDHRLVSNSALQAAFDTATSKRIPAQIGELRDVRYLGNMGRVWHFDKCSDKVVGATPYSLPGTTCWATGMSGYLVNSAALKLLLWSNVYFTAYIRAGLYEDIIISDLLQRQGAELCNYDMKKLLATVQEY